LRKVGAPVPLGIDDAALYFLAGPIYSMPKGGGLLTLLYNGLPPSGSRTYTAKAFGLDSRNYYLGGWNSGSTAAIWTAVIARDTLIDVGFSNYGGIFGNAPTLVFTDGTYAAENVAFFVAPVWSVEPLGAPAPQGGFPIASDAEYVYSRVEAVPKCNGPVMSVTPPPSIPADAVQLGTARGYLYYLRQHEIGR